MLAEKVFEEPALDTKESKVLVILTHAWKRTSDLSPYTFSIKTFLKTKNAGFLLYYAL